MGLVISGVCLALHDDKKVEDVKNLINAHNRTDPHYSELNASSSMGEKGAARTAHTVRTVQIGEGS